MPIDTPADTRSVSIARDLAQSAYSTYAPAQNIRMFQAANPGQELDRSGSRAAADAAQRAGPTMFAGRAAADPGRVTSQALGRARALATTANMGDEAVRGQSLRDRISFLRAGKSNLSIAVSGQNQIASNQASIQAAQTQADIQKAGGQANLVGTVASAGARLAQQYYSQPTSAPPVEGYAPTLPWGDSQAGLGSSTVGTYVGAPDSGP